MQTDTVVADIAARLARLEKSNRRLRLTLVAVVVAASSLALAAAGRQDSKPVVAEVRATRFVLDDGSGKEVASLVSIEGRGTRLQMLDETGLPSVVLVSSRSMQSTLSLGHDGNPGCILSAGANGASILAQEVMVVDRSRKGCATLSASGSEARLKFFSDVSTTPKIVLSTRPDQTNLVLRDGEASIILSASPVQPILRLGDGEASVVLSAKDKGIATIQLDASLKPGRATIASFADGSEALLFGEEPDSPGLTSFGKQADGAGYLVLGDGSRTRVAFGRTSIVNARTGSTESRPVSSGVFFGEDGSIIERIPR